MRHVVDICWSPTTLLDRDYEAHGGVLTIRIFGLVVEFCAARVARWDDGRDVDAS